MHKEKETELSNMKRKTHDIDISAEHRKRLHTRSPACGKRPRIDGYERRHDASTSSSLGGYERKHDASTSFRLDGYERRHGASNSSCLGGYERRHEASTTFSFDGCGRRHDSSTSSSLDGYGRKHDASTRSSLDGYGRRHDASTRSSLDGYGRRHDASTRPSLDGYGRMHDASTSSNFSRFGPDHCDTNTIQTDNSTQQDGHRIRRTCDVGRKQSEWHSHRPLQADETYGRKESRSKQVNTHRFSPSARKRQHNETFHYNSICPSELKFPKLGSRLHDSLPAQRQRRCKQDVNKPWNIQRKGSGLLRPFNQKRTSKSMRHNSGLLGTIAYLSKPRLESNFIATTLANRGEELDTYLQKNDNCPKIVQLVAVLGRCSKAMLCKSNKTQVMYILRRRKFFERKDILGKLKNIRLSDSNDGTKFVMDIMSIMEMMIKTVSPAQADTVIAISVLESIIKHSDVGEGDHIACKEALLNISRTYTKEENPQASEVTENYALTLPILPDIDTIRSEDTLCISMHSINKPFASEQQYISHMYAIFREDLVRPLRKGIKSYISYKERDMVKQFRSPDVRLYEDVSVVAPNARIETGVVWTLRFPTHRRKDSSQLQYGSLLCLSSDSFATIHYATVANRDGMGDIDIKFMGHIDTSSIIGGIYTMLESRAFYEAYSHTLKLMKQLAEGVEACETTLPMGRYLTGQSNEPTPMTSTLGTISLECLEHYGDRTLKPSGSNFIVDMLTFEDWPTSSEVGLDGSQYKALKSVMTQELSLIQGPPGTGKTMMGVRIAEVFICNFHSLRNWEKKPLLLVSYTNHALDQFLQLLLSTPTMGKCVPTDIVRVGSRSKLAELEEFSLKGHRLKARTKTYTCSYRNVKNEEEQIVEIKAILSEYQQYLIHEDSLYHSHAMSCRQYYQLQHEGYYAALPSSGTVLWLWLQPDSALSQEETLEDHQGIPVAEAVVECGNRWIDDMSGEEKDDEENVYTIMKDMLFPLRAIDYESISTHPFKFTDQERDRILNKICQKLSVKKYFSDIQVGEIQDIWQLNLEDRWALYRYWIHEATKPLELKLCIMERQFEAASIRYREARALLDCKIMKNASVVAMTTTAASRYTAILKEVGPSTVVIEEAAQVSEQHALGALSASCQRLIMIGDHQQLGPAFNDYSLAKSHHTDVSLFERLVRCKFPFQQLENQHRMRPEISTLLVPHIYPKLNDDASVFQYPDVRGMASNVYFWTHDVMEDQNDDSASHSNKHEAELLSRLYRHLRLQGYQVNDITVLALYSAQVKLLRNMIQRVEQTTTIITNVDNSEEDTGETNATVGRPLDQCSVQVTTVDNFQGEENRIILLSLVRSNRRKSIGYLAVENRVCVSLSRAREGLYVVGNMACLRDTSELWDKIISKAERNGICGEYLELKCLKHPMHRRNVKKATDFDAIADGGCKQPCTVRLLCGHTCSRKCHSDDPDHQLPCVKPCTKLCDRRHAQQLKCHQTITKCLETVDVELKCGHKTIVMCSRSKLDVKCEERCSEVLSCGHTCQKRCSEICTTEENCNELVMVTGRCSHAYQIACSKRTSGLCSVKCDHILNCGHPCPGNCGKCHQGRLHMPCKKRCERMLVCGHPCHAYCTDVCPPCSKRCTVRCGHSACRDGCAERCVPCREQCEWRCRLWCSNGYTCTNLCSEDCNRPKCNIPCRRRMNCGHKCVALQCEECICKVCSPESQFEIFFGSEDEHGAVFYRIPDCGHIFEVESLDTYMNREAVGTIGEKTCPKCSQPVMNLQRYGNVVRQCFRDIDSVKSKLISNEQDMLEHQYKLRMSMIKMEHLCDKEATLFKAYLKSAKTMSHVTALRNQMSFYRDILSTIKNIDQLMSKRYISNVNGQRLKEELVKLKTWVLIKRFRFSDQEVEEFRLELTRLRFYYRMVAVEETLQRKENVPDEDIHKVKIMVEKLNDGTKLLKEKEEEYGKMATELEKQYPISGLGITNDERIMIIKAMGFTQKGHWNKCKNGHVYAIGECGGAMEESKCPDCSAEIGGSKHRIRDDNTLAAEMDGAQYSAWSMMANMDNFDLNFD